MSVQQFEDVFHFLTCVVQGNVLVMKN